METYKSNTSNEKEWKSDGMQRDKWSNKFQFFIAIVSGSVGLGNVWRFPYLCYINGGGAFLVPYFICVILSGIPIVFLEVSLGQLMSAGGLQAWNICPLMKGIGATCALTRVLSNWYYAVILAWAFFYFFASLTSVLPWSHCNNTWNTENCTMFTNLVEFTNYSYANTSYKNSNYNITKDYAEFGNSTISGITNPVTEFWENRVLRISNGIDEIGSVNWDLALCLLLVWTILFICISKGINTSGNVMYITSTVPFLLLFILLIRGCTLPGALDGIKYYVLPDFERLKEMRIWADAGSQVFLSYTLCGGSMTAMGSYNHFNHNSYREIWLFAFVNSGTSILAGFVIFSTLGFMANQQGVSIGDVAESGPGLAFIAYPQAVSQMPISPLWSILFFLMLLFLGVGSLIVDTEGFMTAVFDQFPQILNISRWRKVAIYALGCSSWCIAGLIMVTNGGMYVFLLFDFYAISRMGPLLGFIECITIAYLYGVIKYYKDLTMMLGYTIGPYMKCCWLILTPIYTIFTFIMCIYTYTTLVYNRSYVYPDWAIGLGWFMAVLPMPCIPIVAVFQIYKGKGTLKQRLDNSLQPVFGSQEYENEGLYLLQKNTHKDKR